MGTEVAPLGEGCDSLNMVLVDYTLEFEKVEARLKDVAVSETTREEGVGLG